MRPHDDIETCRSSHSRLVAAVGSLADDDLRAPSLLPGFSRGHVLAHVINKAHAHARVFGGPPAGEIRQLHPNGHDAKAAAHAGASRSASELRSELERAFEDLDSAWEALDDAHWSHHAVMTAGPRTMVEVVGHHLRNVEVHHVDLDVGYQPSDWPPRFVEAELAKRVRDLTGRADHADLLAWLLHRAPAPALGPW